MIKQVRRRARRRYQRRSHALLYQRRKPREAALVQFEWQDDQHRALYLDEDRCPTKTRGAARRRCWNRASLSSSVGRRIDCLDPPAMATARVTLVLASIFWRKETMRRTFYHGGLQPAGVVLRGEAPQSLYG